MVYDKEKELPNEQLLKQNKNEIISYFRKGINSISGALILSIILIVGLFYQNYYYMNIPKDDKWTIAEMKLIGDRYCDYKFGNDAKAIQVELIKYSNEMYVKCVDVNGNSLGKEEWD